MTQGAKSHWPISILSSLSSLINMALPLVMVRLLPAEQIGQFKIFFLYIAIFPAFSLAPGLVSGLAYWAGQGTRRDRAIQMSACSILGAALLAAALSGIFHGVLTERFAWPDRYSTLFSMALLGAIGSVFFEEAAIATGRIWTGAFFLSGFEVLRTSSMMVTAFVTKSLEAVLLAHTAVLLLKTAVSYGVAYRLELFRLQWDSEVFRSIWKYSLPVASAWIFGIFINNADQFILSTHISPAEFAVYAMGCLTVPPLLIIEQSVTRVMIPQLSAAFASGATARAAALYRRGIEQLALIAIPAVAGLVVFAEGIVSLLFTTQYIESATYLRLYAFTYLLLMIPYDSIPRARGQGGWIFRNFLFFSVFSLGLCWLLVREFGAMGALAGALGSRAVMKSFAIGYVRWSTKWKLQDFLPFGKMATYVAAVLILSAGSLALEPFFSTPLRWFLVCGPAFGILYFPLGLGIDAIFRRRALAKGTIPGPRRVLMVTQYLGVGGLEKMVLNLCLNLRASGAAEPSVFAYEQPEQSDYMHLVPEFRRNGIPVEVYSKKPGFSFKAVAKIVRYIFRHDIHVLHSHDLNGLIYAVAAKIGSMGRVRLVHTQHSFVHLEKANRYKLYEKVFTLFADELTVVSEETKRLYLELGVPQSRLHVVQNGVSFPDAPVGARADKLSERQELLASVANPSHRAILEANPGAIWILYIARLHPVKGHSHAVRVWSALSPQYRKRALLLMVGPATHQELVASLRAQISGTEDGDRILMLGGTHEPQRWLKAADVYISCSDFEGMPLGPLEGLGSGLPALLSRIPGHEFLSTEAELFSSADPEEGARKLEKLCRDVELGGSEYYSALWERTGWVRKGYSVKAMAETYAGLYAPEGVAR